MTTHFQYQAMQYFRLRITHVQATGNSKLCNELLRCLYQNWRNTGTLRTKCILLPANQHLSQTVRDTNDGSRFRHLRVYIFQRERLQLWASLAESAITLQPCDLRMLKYVQIMWKHMQFPSTQKFLTSNVSTFLFVSNEILTTNKRSV